MYTVQVDNVVWGLEHRHESFASRLLGVLDRHDWGFRDIVEVSRMIDREPVIKEAVVELLNAFKSKGE